VSPQRFILLTAVGTLLACAPDPAGPREDGWSGELATYVVDRGQRVELEHRLRADDGTVRPLILDQALSLAPGTRLHVWGEPAGEAIHVGRYRIEAPAPQAISQALVSPPAKPLRRWAFVLVDVDGGGNKIDKVNAQSVLFSADRPDSIRSYFKEVSYGIQDLDGQVFGPFPYQMGGRCDTDRLATALIPMIEGKFDQYLFFFGTQQAACNWAGIADLGRADRPTRNSWYNSFDQCNVLVQEPGHNFGMVHSSAMRCTLNGQPVPIAWPDQAGADCQHEEYGNPFDPMGGGDCFHMNGIQKAYQDWLSGCNIVKATASGTFTIYPIESACDGAQLLQIPFPQSRAFSNAGDLTSYYLELRTPVGRDRRLRPEVLVMVANDPRASRFTGNANWLLDMTPETNKPGDEPMIVGKPFQDALPGGPKFTLVSVDATKAVVQVELQGQAAPAGQAGKGVCDDASDYQPTAPTRCVAPATPDGGTPASKPDAGDPSVPDAGTAEDTAPAIRHDAAAKPPVTGGSGGGNGGEGETTLPPQSTSKSPGGCAVAPGPTGGAALPLLFLLLATRRRRTR
jgi:MYXO-CTERM domain-containing protein